MEALRRASFQRKIVITVKFIPVILAIVLALPSLAQGSSEFESRPRPAFEYGPRPPLSVFDPAGFLKPEVVKEISEPLAAIYRNEGIDVIVVVLADLGKTPPELVAGRFAEAWCKSPMHCTVLHVPGRENSPWIVPAGRLVGRLNPQQIQPAVADAQRRASLEPNDADKVKAAATAAADMLRHWTADAINRRMMSQSKSTRMRADLEYKTRQWRIATMVVAASVIPLVSGISFLIVSLRNRGPRFFPDHAKQLRLGAPHAGGNHAVADLGPPMP